MKSCQILSIYLIIQYHDGVRNIMYIFVTFLIVIFFGISAFLTFVCDNSIKSGLVQGQLPPCLVLPLKIRIK